MKFRRWLELKEAAIGRTRQTSGTYSQGGRGRFFGPSGEFGAWQGRYAERPPLEKLAVGAVASVGNAVRKFSRLEPGNIPTLDRPPSREYEHMSHIVLPLMVPQGFEGDQERAEKEKTSVQQFAQLWSAGREEEATQLMRPIDLKNQYEVSAAQAFMKQVARTIFWQRLYTANQLGHLDFDNAEFPTNISYYTNPPTITIIMQANPIQQGAQGD
jgi:hypothetical protein